MINDCCNICLNYNLCNRFLFLLRTWECLYLRPFWRGKKSILSSCIFNTSLYLQFTFVLIIFIGWFRLFRNLSQHVIQMKGRNYFRWRSWLYLLFTLYFLMIKDEKANTLLLKSCNKPLLLSLLGCCIFTQSLHFGFFLFSALHDLIKIEILILTKALMKVSHWVVVQMLWNAGRHIFRVFMLFFLH